MKETCNLLIENARKFLDPASLFQVCIMKGFLSMQRLGLCNKSSSMNFQMSCLHLFLIGLCLVHVIWTKRRMLKLVLNVKYLLLLSFLTENEFYNLRHNQGIIGMH